MKSPPRRVLIPAVLSALVLACLAAPNPAAAQSGGTFNLSWSAVGAGAVGSGGSFSLSSLISPGNAGRSTGGTFVLDGGWGGVLSTIDVSGGPPTIPTSFAWQPPRPNPLTSSTAIAFELPRAVATRLALFDLDGRCVRVLADATLAPGGHRVEWDGRGANGARLPGGIYFVSIDAGEFHRSSRVVLLH